MVLLGAVVVLTASDSDRPTGPRVDDARPSAGAESAHLEVPVITDVAVEGLQVTVGWTWAARRAWDGVSTRVTVSEWDPSSGRFIGEEVVQEETRRKAGSYRADSIVRDSFSFDVPTTGLYSFRIDLTATDRIIGRAGHGFGQAASWRAWVCEKVLVGGRGWSVVPLPGTRDSLVHDARDARFTLFYELYHGPSLVRDCDADYLIEWPAAVYQRDCDWDTGERALTLANPDPGKPGAWRLTLARDEDRRPFADLELRSVLRDNGPATPRRVRGTVRGNPGGGTG